MAAWRISSCRARASCICSGWSSHMAVEPSMSVKRKVTVPVGMLDLFLLDLLTVLLPDAPSVTLWSLSPPRAEGHCARPRLATYAPIITDPPHFQKAPRILAHGPVRNTRSQASTALHVEIVRTPIP